LKDKFNEEIRMMKGITPISELKIPKTITLGFMLERVGQRKIAAGCTRCGGTGNYSTVGFPGTGSRYGTHCFGCGDAWKLPLKWSRMEPKDIADLFAGSLDHKYNIKVIDDFVEVGILSRESADEVITLLKGK